MKRAYKVVDVFTKTPLLGNPVAVVLDADGLDTKTMQAIASWTNLSETTFLLPPTKPQADYRLRIFTPKHELPFAGHPTLGSAHAALEAGRAVPRNGVLVQECGVGLVELAVEEDGANRTLSFAVPPAKLTPLNPAQIERLEGILGATVERKITPMIVDMGVVWIVAQLSSASKVLALRPDFGRSAAFEHSLGATGITVFGPHETDDTQIEVRSFACSQGVQEDPVCGSGNASVAVFRQELGLLPKGRSDYTATQGHCLGRAGRIAVHIHAGDGQITIGGQCVTAVDGVLKT